MAKLSDFSRPIGGGCSEVDVFALFGALNMEAEKARKQARKNK